MSNSVTVYVKYTAPGAGGANIGYSSDSAGNNPWSPPTVQGTPFTFTLKRADTGSKFEFEGITFWAKDSFNQLVSQVARTFKHKNSGGSAEFNGQNFVTNVNVGDKEIKFTVTNASDGSGFISFQTTIDDKNANRFCTSVDPMIPLLPQGG